eukprot:jgi/Botrbrau1/6038/Bobra.0042s0023.1
MLHQVVVAGDAALQRNLGTDRWLQREDERDREMKTVTKSFMLPRRLITDTLHLTARAQIPALCTESGCNCTVPPHRTINKDQQFVKKYN